MKTFTIEKKMVGSELKVSISGYIDENAIFLPITETPQSMVIDLGQATGINSVGTKNWCKWVQDIRPPTIASIENCPVIFIKTFNNVIGTLSKNVKIRSFFVPHLSTDGSGVRKDVLFTLGKEIDASHVIHSPKVFDDNKKEMEMDVLPNFFNFLKK